MLSLRALRCLIKCSRGLYSYGLYIVLFLSNGCSLRQCTPHLRSLRVRLHRGHGVVSLNVVMAYIVMAYIVMAYIGMAYVFLAYAVMTHRAVRSVTAI